MTRELRAASQLPPAELAALFGRGYEGYFVPIHVDPPMLERMIAAWHLDLEASRALFAEGALAGFAMLGRRGDRGWIGGMGVVPERRGLGLGRLLMEAVLAEAWRRRLVRVDLEVLEQNTPAIRIYEALGFRELRVLDIWTREPAGLDGGDGLPAAETIDVGDALDAYPALHRARAPWQRDRPALEAMRARLRAVGVRTGGRIEASAMVRVQGGRLAIEDLGVAVDARADAIEAALREGLRGEPEAAATMINLPTNDPAAPVLARLGFQVTLRQREMSLVP